MHVTKTKSFICVEMLEESQKFKKLFFLVFSSRKQGSKYVQNIWLAPDPMVKDVCLKYESTMGTFHNKP